MRFRVGDQVTLLSTDYWEGEVIDTIGGVTVRWDDYDDEGNPIVAEYENGDHLSLKSRPIKETVVDVTPPKFKPGDRVIVVDDATTDFNGMVGTVTQVWKSFPTGDSLSVVFEDGRYRGAIPFNSSEVEHHVAADPVLTRRELQIVDALTEAHTTTQVVEILRDYRLIG